jgi:hypothetical protein
MDSVTQLANTEVLKEPRGFIKIIQIALAIFAFATCTAYYSSTEYTVSCPNGATAAPTAVVTTNTIKFGYPFRLNDAKIKVNVCSSSNTTEKNIYGDYSSAAEFYVFVGVTAFLYSLGILIFYVFGDDKYRNVELIPIVDFVVTAIYGAFWLISSAVWADGVSKIKHYTDPNDYMKDKEYACECVPSAQYCPQGKCAVTNGGNYATINVSVIFGFLCMCVWAGNLWFLYKETKWFKSSQQMPPPAMPQQSMPSDIPQSI